MTPPFPNSYWLEPGRILCGEYPRDFDDLEDHEGMSAILQAGVRVFIDLTEEGELKPYREIALATATSLGIDTGQLTFLRHPIRDVSVPRRSTEMREILRSIRRERHRGRAIYLHCWGGRGRTGTVAGCVLNELFGHRGEEALAVLSSRWRACAKSEWSDSPETEEQRRYVREWNPAGTVTPSIIRAALLGAAIGDVLGVPVEFQGRSARKADPVTGMRAYGTHHQPAGTWSDDTSMILATMTGLIESGGTDPAAVMHQFVIWMDEAHHTPHGVVFDIGNATREALTRSRSGTPPLECGGKTEWSNGNGSLMRILPIALAYTDDPDLIAKASEISSLTHAHERSRFCCAFYCLVASDLMHGGSIEEATTFAWEVLNHRWTFSPAERHHFDALHPDLLFARQEDEIRSSGHVVDTLEAALWVNARHDDFANAVLHAVNLGDDTDTTGCVAGGLAGILHGEGSIPAEWSEGLARRAELVAMAERFAQFCDEKAGT
jgi:ADP-ribosyl-[dinitrogen reductase] hydrolase